MSDLFHNIANGIGTDRDPNFHARIRDKRPQGLDWETIRAIYKNNEICQNAINFKSQTPIKNGRTWKVKSENPEDAKKLEDLEKKLDFQKVMREALFHMYLYGGCLVLLHTDAEIKEGDNPETWASELWASNLSKEENVTALSVLPIFRTGVNIELDSEQLSENFGKPKYFKINNSRGIGKINASRCLVFKRSPSFDYYASRVSRYDFFGYSLFEPVFTLIKIYEANNNTLLDMAQDSQRIVVQSPMLTQKLMKAGDRKQIEEEFRKLNYRASNISITVLGDGDEMEVVKKDYQQIIDSQKDITLRIMGAFGVPEVLGLGKAMTGLGDDPSGYLNIYHEPIVEFQKSDLSDFIRPLDEIMIRQCGFTQETTSYEWNPLANPSEKDEQEILSLKIFNLKSLKETANLTQSEVISEITSLNLTANPIKGSDSELQHSFEQALQNLKETTIEKKEEEKQEENLMNSSPVNNKGIPTTRKLSLLEKIRRIIFGRVKR